MCIMYYGLHASTTLYNVLAIGVLHVCVMIVFQKSKAQKYIMQCLLKHSVMKVSTVVKASPAMKANRLREHMAMTMP